MDGLVRAIKRARRLKRKRDAGGELEKKKKEKNIHLQQRYIKRCFVRQNIIAGSDFASRAYEGTNSRRHVKIERAAQEVDEREINSSCRPVESEKYHRDPL